MHTKEPAAEKLRPEEFSVVQFFANDAGYEYVCRFVDGETAVETALQLSRSVGGRMGFVEKIIITDGGDYTVFEWQYGKGVTYPERV